MRKFAIGFGAVVVLGLIVLAVLRSAPAVPGQADPREARLVAQGMAFRDYPGTYVYHCHDIEHEDGGMMRNYRVEA